MRGVFPASISSGPINFGTALLRLNPNEKLALGVASSFLILSAGSAHAAPAPREVRFDVLEYLVEGNTVLPPGVVEQVLQPFMGPGKTFKDLESAREALEKPIKTRATCRWW